MLRYTWCIAALIATNAAAFEIDGLTAGLSREKAIAQLESFGLRISSDNEDRLLATALNRFYNLSFCKGSLVLVQKNLEPTFDSFVALVSRFRNLYGAPSNVDSELPDPTSYAPNHSLSISWRNKAELITVEHNSYRSNAQTSVTYIVRNSCAQHPLLSQ